MASFFLSTEEIKVIKREQDKAILLYAVFAGGVIILGLIMLFVGQFVSDDDTSKTMFQLGGGFVATLSGFQIKEVIARREVITGLNLLTAKVEKYSLGEPTAEEAKQVNDVLERLMQRLLNL